MFDIEQLRTLPWIERAIREAGSQFTHEACINYAQGWIQGMKVAMLSDMEAVKVLVFEGSKCDTRLAAGLFWSAEMIQAEIDLDRGATKQ